MRQTRIATRVALVLLAVAVVPALAAVPRNETPSETIARLKNEAAQFRMQLNQARMSAKRAKALKDEATVKAKVAEVGLAVFKKEMSVLKDQAAKLAAQNERIQLLLATEAGKTPDAKIRDVLTQLVQSLKDGTRLNALNKELDDKNKKLQAQVEQMAKSLLAARRDLAVKTKALNDLRQDLAIEKGKRIAPAAIGPATTIVDPTKRAPEPKIATKIRAVSGNLASIDVGADAGVKAGMKLLITRGNDYVATLVISQVEKSQAAGELVDVKVTPKSGDTVGNMP